MSEEQKDSWMVTSLETGETEKASQLFGEYMPKVPNKIVSAADEPEEEGMSHEYRQSMSAVIRVSPSGYFDILSLHDHIERAYAEAARLRELGEDEWWDGARLRVIPGCNADVYGAVDVYKLKSYLGP